MNGAFLKLHEKTLVALKRINEAKENVIRVCAGKAPNPAKFFEHATVVECFYKGVYFYWVEFTPDPPYDSFRISPVFTYGLRLPCEMPCGSYMYFHEMAEDKTKWPPFLVAKEKA